MKPLLLRILSCMLICSFLYIGKSYGQLCPNNQPYSSVSYDTTAIGNGNNIYKIPQFDPSIGTLYSVDFSSEIYFKFNYTLANPTASAQSYTVNGTREDLLKATSPTDPSPITLIDEYSDFIFRHNGSQNPLVPVGSTDYSRNILNPKNISYTITNNIVPYLGADSLYLTYSTVTESGGFGNNQLSISSKEAKDSIVFRITYNYCPSAALPSTFIKLTAQAQNSNILLAWTSQQILSGGSFELLKSIDGRTYISVNKQDVNTNSLAGYNYLYKPTAKDPSKAFFRIKQTDQNGNITYSKVITVILPTNNNSGSVEEGTEKNLVVYPTIPTGNFVNVFIPSGTNTDEWTISIISLAGRVMQQSKFSKTNLARVDFINPLAPGMYIVDAYNTRTQEHFKDKIVVQH